MFLGAAARQDTQNGLVFAPFNLAVIVGSLLGSRVPRAMSTGLAAIAAGSGAPRARRRRCSSRSSTMGAGLGVASVASTKPRHRRRRRGRSRASRRASSTRPLSSGRRSVSPSSSRPPPPSASTGAGPACGAIALSSSVATLEGGRQLAHLRQRLRVGVRAEADAVAEREDADRERVALGQRDRRQHLDALRAEQVDGHPRPGHVGDDEVVHPRRRRVARHRRLQRRPAAGRARSSAPRRRSPARSP